MELLMEMEVMMISNVRRSCMNKEKAKCTLGFVVASSVLICLVNLR
jgi:hypothetical protein